jgi:diguanylate cyclase (GGDEF)-like protein
MIIVDHGLVVLFANHRASLMFGAAVGEPLGFDVRPNTCSDVTLPGGQVAEVLAVPTTWRGTGAVLATVRDVTEMRSSARAAAGVADDLAGFGEALDDLSMRDPLTGLLNRRGAERALELAWRRPTRGPAMACVLLDCDELARINGDHGRNSGDRALVSLAGALRASIRPGDHAARVGGDEFVVLLSGTSAAEGVRIAQRICDAVSLATAESSAGSVRVTCSAGVVAVAVGASLDDAIGAADLALVRSKVRGRDRVSLLPQESPVDAGLVIGVPEGVLLGRSVDVGTNVDALYQGLELDTDVAHFRVAARALTAGRGHRRKASAIRPGALVVASGTACAVALCEARDTLRGAGARFGLDVGWTMDTLVSLAPDSVAVDARWTFGLAQPEQRIAFRRLIGALEALGSRPFAIGARREEYGALAELGIGCVVEDHGNPGTPG